MKIKTPCSTKGCRDVHVTITPGPGGYATPPEPCLECAEKKTRADAADDFIAKSRRR